MQLMSLFKMFEEINWQQIFSTVMHDRILIAARKILMYFKKDWKLDIITCVFYARNVIFCHSKEFLKEQCVYFTFFLILNENN